MSRPINPPIPKGERPVDASQNAVDDSPLSLASVSGEDAAKIVAEFLRTAHLMRCLLSSHFAAFGLTDTWFTVLEVLSRSAPEGCSQVKLAAVLGQSESSVSTLVERMRSHGLLHRLRSKSDRRRHVLVATERGQMTCSVVRECHHKRMAHLLSGLCENELGMFSSLLSRLGTELTHIKSSCDARDVPDDTLLTMSNSGASSELLGRDDQRKPAA